MVEYLQAIDAFIDALRKIGLERISDYYHLGLKLEERKPEKEKR